MEAIVVTRSPKRDVEILIAHEDLVVTRTRYAAGQRGPDPHVHRKHADAFYVLDGAFTLVLDDGERVLGPGTFVLVPPNVVHAFRNDGPGETHFLNLHAPGTGFDRYLLEMRDAAPESRAAIAASFDQHPPPADGLGVRAEAGSWMHVPPGVVHTFAFSDSAEVRFLDFHTPSRGFGDFLRALHAARDDVELAETRARFDQEPAP